MKIDDPGIKDNCPQLIQRTEGIVWLASYKSIVYTNILTYIPVSTVHLKFEVYWLGIDGL